MKNSEINKLILFSIVLFAFFLIFACIEMRPREGLSTQVNAIVESGSDICTGYTEETCGAFTKEKSPKSITEKTIRSLKYIEVISGKGRPARLKACYLQIKEL